MNHFDAKFIAKRVGDFARIECEFTHADATARSDDLPLSLGNLQKTLTRTINKMSPLRMDRTKRTLEDIQKETETKQLPAPALGTFSRMAMKAVTEELGARKFLYVAPEFSAHVDQDTLFGDAVWTKFEHARPDIREAGNCLAADCNTAAVFHLMRAVEWALRAFCTDLGMKKLRCKNKKTGKVTYKPLEFSQWEQILNDVKTRVQDKINRLSRGHQKQALQEFYLPAVQDFEGFRDAFRNHVMHTRRDYIPGEAVAIRDRVQRFMDKLAERLEEV